MKPLHCKAVGHSWDLYTPSLRKKRGQIGYKLCFICLNCQSERIDTIDIYGRILFRAYRYSKEYRDSKRMSRDSPYSIREQYRSAYLNSLKG